ncbi:carbohydrate sulfotransferase 10-like [Branchiostoma floridae x Branchiostoma japonicum]
MNVREWLRSSKAVQYILVGGVAVLVFGFTLQSTEVGNLHPSFLRLGTVVAGHWKKNNMSLPQPLPVKLSGKQNDRMDQDQEQTRRKELVEEYCKNKSSSNMLSRRMPMGNFYVSDRYKVLYCKVGKTGSTTTSALLYNLEFGTNSNEEEYWKHQATTPMKRLTSYTKDEQRLRLNTYRKLVVARNPLERLVSDYLFFFGGKEHFVSNGRQVRDNMKYQDMLETIGWNASTTKLPYTEDYGFFKTKNETYHLVPFLAFIRAVTDDTNRWQNNEHWALVSDYCPLCQD